MLFPTLEGHSKKSEARRERALFWWQDLQRLKISGERGALSSASGMRNPNNQTSKLHVVPLGQALLPGWGPAGLLGSGQQGHLKEMESEHL